MQIKLIFIKKSFARGLILKQAKGNSEIAYSILWKTLSTAWLFLYRNSDLIRDIATKEDELKDQAKRYN